MIHGERHTRDPFSISFSLFFQKQRDLNASFISLFPFCSSDFSMGSRDVNINRTPADRYFHPHIGTSPSSRSRQEFVANCRLQRDTAHQSLSKILLKIFPRISQLHVVGLKGTGRVQFRLENVGEKKEKKKTFATRWIIR